MDQVFRDESGGPNLSPDARLRLELKDFAPEDLAEGISDSFLINLPYYVNFSMKRSKRARDQARARSCTTSAPRCKETTSGRDATRGGQFG